MGHAARREIVLATVIGLFLTSGCATLRPKSADRTQIRDAVETWAVGVAALDTETIMRPFSENFQLESGQDKAAFGGWLQQAINQGQLDDAELYMGDSDILIDDESATMTNVELRMGGGRWRFDLFLNKENDGVWRIVGMESVSQ